MDLIACIGATDLFIMMYFINAACAAYDDFRSHTCSATTLGYSIVCSISSKQKINTSSSTHAKLTSISDYFLKLSRAKLFLEAQDVVLKRNIAYQTIYPLC